MRKRSSDRMGLGKEYWAFIWQLSMMRTDSYNRMFKKKVCLSPIQATGIKYFRLGGTNTIAI